MFSGIKRLVITGGSFTMVDGGGTGQSRVDEALHRLYRNITPGALFKSSERSTTLQRQAAELEALFPDVIVPGRHSEPSSSTSDTIKSSLHENHRKKPDRVEYPNAIWGELKEMAAFVHAWLMDEDQKAMPILWMHGSEHSELGELGPSIVAQLVATKAHERGELTAAYFCSGAHSEPGSNPGRDRRYRAHRLVPTLAYQAAQHIPEAKEPIALSIISDPSILDLRLQSQIQALILEPLYAAAEQSISPPGPQPSKSRARLFVIYGLENIEGKEFQKTFLSLLADVISIMRASGHPQKLLVIGRFTKHLEDCFDASPLRDMSLHIPMVFETTPTPDTEEAVSTIQNNMVFKYLARHPLTTRVMALMAVRVGMVAIGLG